MESKKLTRKDLTAIGWRSAFLQASFNYERMQGCGYLFSVLPGLKKIYSGDQKALSRAMKTHMEFFNTNPIVAPFIMGLTLALEGPSPEQSEVVSSIKVATFGPVGGIGDALVWYTVLPITAGIGASLASQGNVFGPLIFLLLFNAVHASLRFGLLFYAYRLGLTAVSSITEQTKKISRAASILGCGVLGALIAGYVHLTTTVKFNLGPLSGKDEAGKVFSLQADLFDKIVPDLLPLLYVFLMYYLIKKSFNVVVLILLTMLFGIAGHYAAII